jgi:hypothetical protein
MSHQVVEKKPREGCVFLVKYTFDNTTWNQFFASRVQESGGVFTFFGCRVKVVGVDSEGHPLLSAGKLPDVQLDGRRARLLALVVKEPVWYEAAEQGTVEDAPDFAISSLRLPGLADYK